jgi:hypothetical protein
MAEQQHYTEVPEENTMPAQDYERGRFAIRDIFASSRSPGVVYGAADSGVTGLPYVTDALPICDRAAAQRDVELAGGRGFRR